MRQAPHPGPKGKAFIRTCHEMNALQVITLKRRAA